MELERRYIFNGSAAAYGGRFVRPQDVVLAASGGSALSVVGGRSEWKASGIKIGRSFRVRSAESLAEGLVDSRRDAVRASHGQMAQEDLTATTTVSAFCRGVDIGGAPPARRGDEPEPRMQVAEVGATVVSRSNAPGHESSVIIRGATLSTVVFSSPVHGRFALDVVLDLAPFKRADTRSKVLLDKGIPTVHGDGDRVYATIVKALVWQNEKEYPGAEPIGVNGVRIPNLGRFYFGELVIRTGTRRLTMVRMRLGSPTGGDCALSDVDTNGSWSL